MGDQSVGASPCLSFPTCTAVPGKLLSAPFLPSSCPGSTLNMSISLCSLNIKCSLARSSPKTGSGQISEGHKHPAE